MFYTRKVSKLIIRPPCKNVHDNDFLDWTCLILILILSMCLNIQDLLTSSISTAPQSADTDKAIILG